MKDGKKGKNEVRNKRNNVKARNEKKKRIKGMMVGRMGGRKN